MLELLLYCHMLANIRFAAEIAAVMDFVESLKTRCRHLFAPAAASRREPAYVYSLWLEQSLDRLDAYVGSAA